MAEEEIKKKKYMGLLWEKKEKTTVESMQSQSEYPVKGKKDKKWKESFFYFLHSPLY